MLGQNGSPRRTVRVHRPSVFLTIVGESAQIEGKFNIADSIQIECEIGGELSVATSS